MDVLEWVFYGNSMRTWLLALLAALVCYAALRLAQGLVLRSLERLARRTAGRLDDIAAEVLRGTRSWFLVVLSVRAGSLLLLLPESLRTLVAHLAVLAVLVQIGIWGGIAIRAHVAGYSVRKAQEDAASVTTVTALGFLASVALWAVLVLVALDTLGVEITALVAGLGVGGVAVALAVQNILGDLFASLSIVLDKPFVYGDFIVVGDMAGSVEHVGLKTTRVRSLSGEQLVFSNSDLLQSRVRNFKRMSERRVVAVLGVTYQTPPERLAAAPGLIRQIVEAQPDVRFDRAHFRDFGDSALNLEFVYFVLSSDYNVYMDRQQAINLEIFRRFQAEGLDFAYPTRTLHLVRDGRPEPADSRFGSDWRPEDRQ